jgi:hypothetical protein
VRPAHRGGHDAQRGAHERGRAHALGQLEGGAGVVARAQGVAEGERRLGEAAGRLREQHARAELLGDQARAFVLGPCEARLALGEPALAELDGEARLEEALAQIAREAPALFEARDGRLDVAEIELEAAEVEQRGDLARTISDLSAQRERLAQVNARGRELAASCST